MGFPLEPPPATNRGQNGESGRRWLSHWPRAGYDHDISPSHLAIHRKPLAESPEQVLQALSGSLHRQPACALTVRSSCYLDSGWCRRTQPWMTPPQQSYASSPTKVALAKDGVCKLTGDKTLLRSLCRPIRNHYYSYPLHRDGDRLLSVVSGTVNPPPPTDIQQMRWHLHLIDIISSKNP